VSQVGGFEESIEGASRQSLLWKIARDNAFWTSITVGTALASCIFQLVRYEETIQGVLLVWPVIGLLFAIIKTGMFTLQWQRLKTADIQSNNRILKQGKIVFNVAGLVTLMLTNSVMLAVLLQKGIDVWHWTTFITLGLAVGSGVLWYLHRHRGLDRQLLILGTGINIIPTYLQGVSYIFRGASGMPMGSALILMVMSFAMYRQSLPVYAGLSLEERRKKRKEAIHSGRHPEVLLPKWDFICQVVAFGICWALATFVLPYLGFSWWPFV
jgi:hypothetical protein